MPQPLPAQQPVGGPQGAPGPRGTEAHREGPQHGVSVLSPTLNVEPRRSDNLFACSLFPASVLYQTHVFVYSLFPTSVLYQCVWAVYRMVYNECFSI